MHKYKLRKQVIIIPIIVLTLILILIFIFSKNKNNSYSVEYNIDNYNITESYDKEYLSYYFEIEYNEKKYPFIYSSNRLKDKKIIKDIDYIEKDNINCLNIISNHFETIPLCYKDDILQDFDLTEVEELNNYRKNNSNIDKQLKNYTIYNDDANVLIWDYKGFNYIKNKEINEIKLFNKDVYEIPFYMTFNNYILIPDYEQEYTFNKIYVVDTNNMSISKWNINYDISFNSAVLGNNDKSLFILDKQNKIEYELVPHKQKIRIVSSKTKGIIYEYGKSKKVTINSLMNNNSSFKYYNIYNYELINNSIYLSYMDHNLKYKITKQDVDKIAFINNESIYYISEDKLYGYNPTKGEYLIMSYNEFIYNKNFPIYIN